MGSSNLTRYQQAIPLGDGRTFMPVYSSKRLSRRSDHIKQAVIVLHGLSGRAYDIFCEMTSTTHESHVEDHTLTLAPWFSQYFVTGHQWDRKSSTTQDMVSACWPDSSWKSGAKADNGNLTSYGVLDEIVSRLQAASHTLPQLSRIVFVGFSAGCQMASHWSFLSRSLLPGSGRANTTVILGGCGAYMYFDDERPAPQCTALYETTVEHKCSMFRKVDDQDCPRHSRHGISLDLPESRDAHGEYPLSIQRALEEFPSKDIRYLFGSVDVCSCNLDGYHNPDNCYTDICWPHQHGGTRNGTPCCDSGHINALRQDCRSLLQGANRLQRGLNYVDYLRHFYAKRGVNFEPPIRIYDGGHNFTLLRASERFRGWVFSADDSCDLAFQSKVALTRRTSHITLPWLSQNGTAAPDADMSTRAMTAALTATIESPASA